MKYAFTVVSLMIVLIGLSPAALRADTATFIWTDTTLCTCVAGPSVTASGTLTATSIGGGEYVVTSGSGTINGDSLTLYAGLDNGSIQTDPHGLFNFDNLLYPTSTLIDNPGLIFLDTTTGGEWNILYAGPGAYSSYLWNGSYTSQAVTTSTTLTLTAVPEPRTIGLLLSGLFGLGLLAAMKCLRGSRGLAVSDLG